MLTDIRIGKIDHGNGYWKFNVSLEKNESFVETVKNVWKQKLGDHERVGSDMVKFWESTKSLFQGICIYFGRQQKQHHD